MLESIDSSRSSLRRKSPETEALRLIPETMARKYMAIPLAVDGNVLRVAMANPADIFALEALASCSQMRIEPEPATQEEVMEALDFNYKAYEEIESRCADAGARGRASGARPRDEQVVEGGAARRVPRLQPEREGPHGGVGVFGPPDAGRTRLHPAHWEELADSDPSVFTIDTVPERFARVGDPSAGIDAAAGSLEGLLELADQHEAAGFGDAPWPPQYAKAEGEPTRVQPSRRKTGPAPRDGIVPPPAPGKTAGPTGRRRTTAPLIEIARAETEAEAREGLERWKGRHPEVVPRLQPADVMVDAMRGRSTTWTRIRINLRNVPEDDRPQQEALEVDYDPWAGYAGPRP